MELSLVETRCPCSAVVDFSLDGGMRNRSVADDLSRVVAGRYHPVVAQLLLLEARSSLSDVGVRSYNPVDVELSLVEARGSRSAVVEFSLDGGMRNRSVADDLSRVVAGRYHPVVAQLLLLEARSSLSDVGVRSYNPVDVELSLVEALSSRSAVVELSVDGGMRYRSVADDLSRFVTGRYHPVVAQLLLLEARSYLSDVGVRSYNPVDVDLSLVELQGYLRFCLALWRDAVVVTTMLELGDLVAVSHTPQSQRRCWYCCSLKCNKQTLNVTSI